jgi:molybdenum cofactor cytidylyltransferase
MTKVAALLMAAGNSRRMGGPNKLLMTFLNKPLISFAVQALKDADFDKHVMVTGRDAETVSVFATGFEVAINPSFAEGFGTSLAVGFSAMLNDADIDGALVMLADMPLITSAHLDQLTRAFDVTAGQAIIRAGVNGQPGNPVIIPKALFSKMAALDGEQSGQAIIKSSGLPIILVNIGPAALADADTPEALAALQEVVL